MLAQKNRFHRRNAVKAVLFKGSHKSVGPFKVVILPVRKTGDPATAAVVVSKKVVKSAVTRNRIRRRVFAVLEAHWIELMSDVPLQMVVVCYEKDVATKAFSDIERDLLAAIKHAKQRLKR